MTDRMGMPRKVGPTATPGLPEFFRLCWLTSVKVLQAVVDGRDLPRPTQVSGTARQQEYGLLIQFQGEKYPAQLSEDANQEAIRRHWREKITTLSAYKWLEQRSSYDIALDKARIVKSGTPRHICFVHVLAMAMGEYHIERDPSSRSPKVDKRKVGSALSTSKKLRRIVSRLRDLGTHAGLLKELQGSELVWNTYLLEHTRHDRTHPDRVFRKALSQGFKNHFNDPMATVVEELRAIVD